MCASQSIVQWQNLLLRSLTLRVTQTMSSGVDDNGSDKESTSDNYYDSDQKLEGYSNVDVWYCTNCTMPNYKEVYHCEDCGEHKESAISGYDSFLSSIGQADLIDPDTVRNAQRQCPDSLSKVHTAIGFDERMLLHFEVLPKSPHIERPDRLKSIAAGLAAAGIFPGKCILIPAREITQEELQLVHSLEHIDFVQGTSQLFSSYFTEDTYANMDSACAANIAAGISADLALSIMPGFYKNGFALVRPPGHHAGIKQAMGFCLHNNAAVAASIAQSVGAEKVLIVDWDIHHGNGTQEIFEGNKSVLYISLHRHDDGFFPGTGAADEVGTMDAEGYSVNIPWSCSGVGDNDYIFAFQNIVLPIASEFAPDIIIISAGFDAARGDPLGCCDVTPDGFAQMTQLLTALAEGKLLVILEGGYNLRSISSSATAVVKVLIGENPEFEMSNIQPSNAGLLTVLRVLKIQLKYWPILKSNYITVRSQWRKRRHLRPVWWKWGSRRFTYEWLFKRRRH